MIKWISWVLKLIFKIINQTNFLKKILLTFVEWRDKSEYYFDMIFEDEGLKILNSGSKVSYIE